MRTTATKQESAVDYLYEQLQASQTKEDFLLSLWIYWVESVTISHREFSQVLANAPVNKWFLSFVAKEEKEFQLLAKSYSELAGQGKEIDKLYVKCVSKVMSYFPQSLIEAAKRRTEKPRICKFSGIKIEFSTLNQN
ncbi:hypothetical protein GCM10008015_26560 [Flavobacterium palustre]|uniref:Uncharacterized protein n=1 Tax=Flavobacterium palustre TaxID=1476463 RepID=A0ABQ1HNL2_9FLAO|nr:hypothetical protein [Flavobacterium palustre]GGA84460.1 hypothetical protein GCM10008015_26560 [Flavobacterium palustre]